MRSWASGTAVNPDMKTTGNPGLNAQFHLNSGSPAIDAGQSSPAARDYDTQPRNGNPDIGADEFGNGDALQVPPPSNVIGTGADAALTAAKDVYNNITLSIFPNPTSQEIRVEMAETGDVLLTLYDKNGRTIKQVAGIKMAVNGLNTGVYYLKVKTSKGEAFRPVMICP